MSALLSAMSLFFKSCLCVRTMFSNPSRPLFGSALQVNRLPNLAIVQTRLEYGSANLIASSCVERFTGDRLLDRVTWYWFSLIMGFDGVQQPLFNTSILACLLKDSMQMSWWIMLLYASALMWVPGRVQQTRAKFLLETLIGWCHYGEIRDENRVQRPPLSVFSVRTGRWMHCWSSLWFNLAWFSDPYRRLLNCGIVARWLLSAISF